MKQAIPVLFLAVLFLVSITVNAQDLGSILSKDDAAVGESNPGTFPNDDPDDVILHYDGANNNAIGLSAGGTFNWAVDLTDFLGPFYEDWGIKAVQVHIGLVGGTFDPAEYFELLTRVWEGGDSGASDPGSIVYESENWVEDADMPDWYEYTLDEVYPLVDGEGYWVGVQVEHAAGQFPAGCDAGPCEYPVGCWISLGDGAGAWDPLPDLAETLDFNWNVRLVLTYIVSAGETDVPADIVLGLNYPNPFNPSTVIEFTLPNDSHVVLTVYDVLGREVARLVDNEVHAGSHSVTFDASNLTSGVYFYRIQAGDEVKMNKMTLLK